MATIIQVRDVLRGIRPTVGRKKTGHYPVIVGRQEYRLPDDEVDAYLSIREQLARPLETAVFIPGSYEQVVEFHGRGPGRLQVLRRQEQLEMKSNDTAVTIRLGTMSPIFTLSLTDRDQLPRPVSRFAMRPSGRFERDSAPHSLAELFSRMTTILVQGPEDHPGLGTANAARSLADAALFNIAFSSGVGVGLSTSWERSYYWLGRDRRETPQFPRRTYNPELVAYYQLALGSESLILAYLALYKILEYFFTSATEKALHDKVRERLVAPDFSHTKVKKLRDLVVAIRRFDQRMDEKRMLATVLKRYFDAGDLRSWIESREGDDAVYFTNEQRVFGVTQRIDTTDQQIHSSIAARIYDIRNALVHHKEGEVSRFIPFSGQEAELYKEAPLIKHIAEQLIIKAGKDISW